MNNTLHKHIFVEPLEVNFLPKFVRILFGKKYTVYLTDETHEKIDALFFGCKHTSTEDKYRSQQENKQRYSCVETYLEVCKIVEFEKLKDSDSLLPLISNLKGEAL